MSIGRVGRDDIPDVVEGRQLEGLEWTVYLTLLMEGTLDPYVVEDRQLEGLDPDVVEGRQLEGDWQQRQLEGLDPTLLLEGDWKGWIGCCWKGWIRHCWKIIRMKLCC